MRDAAALKFLNPPLATLLPTANERSARLHLHLPESVPSNTHKSVCAIASTTAHCTRPSEIASDMIRATTTADDERSCFSFDGKEFQLTTDIDLIMDDEPSDASMDDADTVDRWQDTAAKLLFADEEPSTGSKQQLSDVGSACGKQSFAARNWNQPCLREESSRLRSCGINRKHAPREIARCASATLPSTVKFEPSQEPCTDDIPWTDLVFWLGDAATGEVECSCAKCVHERARHVGIVHGARRYSPYERISAKIPVINLPRIEGVN